jgi:hypothetical protein
VFKPIILFNFGTMPTPERIAYVARIAVRVSSRPIETTERQLSDSQVLTLTAARWGRSQLVPPR